jgi:hypothetical protein
LMASGGKGASQPIIQHLIKKELHLIK